MNINFLRRTPTDLLSQKLLDFILTEAVEYNKNNFLLNCRETICSCTTI